MTQARKEAPNTAPVRELPLTALPLGARAGVQGDEITDAVIEAREVSL